MPGSTTTRGQHVSCDLDTGCVAFCWTENISAPNLSYAAQYLACALPCERFTSALTDIRASLGAGAVRYSFTVTDFHRLPLAGLPAHPSRHDRYLRIPAEDRRRGGSDSIQIQMFFARRSGQCAANCGLN